MPARARNEPEIEFWNGVKDSNDPEEWAFYTADAATAGGAVRRWPGAAALKNTFARSRKYSPEEGVKAAEKLAH